MIYKHDYNPPKKLSNQEASSMGLPIVRAGRPYDSDFFRELSNKMDYHGIDNVVLDVTIQEDIREVYYQLPNALKD